MMDGLAFVDHIGWDAFNESKDLKKQVDDYRLRFGGKALGRPPKHTVEKIQKMKEQRLQDSRERIPIEGEFGQGKNGCRLNSTRAKLQKTSEAWINCIFLVMNLMVLLKKWCKTLTRSQLTRLFRLCRRLAAIPFGKSPVWPANEFTIP